MAFRWLKRILLVSVMGFVLLLVLHTIFPKKETPTETGAEKGGVAINTEFTHPVRVAIEGYVGSAEEPSLSPDGQYLFFDNRTDTEKDANIFYAKKVNDTTFTFVGEVAGVNTSHLESAPNMDDSGNFYFTSDRSYGTSGSLDTIYRGIFKNGTVTDVRPVPGISSQKKGMVDMDGQISPDGNTLYVSDGDFSHGVPPRSSLIKMTAKNADGSFTQASNSAELLKNVNVGNLNYAPMISRNGLELFFNRTDPGAQSVRMYIAKRSSTSLPFGVPQLIGVADGFVESVFLSRDEKHLYYHRANKVSKEGVSSFEIYMLTKR